MTEDRLERKDFLEKFSESDWLLNGHIKNRSVDYILDSADLILQYSNEGNYLELGCGSGMVCSFLNKFSEGKIIPYGVDINPVSVERAKANNPRFESNFSLGNYLHLDFAGFPEFSTVAIFGLYATKFDVIKNLVSEFVDSGARVLLFTYDPFRDTQDGEFCAAASKYFNAIFPDKRLIVINGRKN